MLIDQRPATGKLKAGSAATQNKTPAHTPLERVRAYGWSPAGSVRSHEVL